MFKAPLRLVSKQVPARSATGRFIAGTDEAGYRIAFGVDLIGGQMLAQRIGAALPLRRIVERGFLRGMTVGNG